MSHIFNSFEIKGHFIKNRIVMPPMVCFFWSDEHGLVSIKHIDHYEQRAKGGTGIIIVEATCVNPNGRIFVGQLGLWNDSQIFGFEQITAAIKKYDALALLQIHHAGLITGKGVTEKVASPTAHASVANSYTLSIDEINSICNEFVATAKRAHQAGFDGVELHGAHGYLLNQFANKTINQRTDAFGGNIQNRLRLAKNIIDGIRAELPEDFIVGYRIGANTPDLNDGIEVAKTLETYNIDYLHSSHGGFAGNVTRVPEGFGYNKIVYCGTQIKQNVKLPVIVVNEIKTPERANYLLEKNLADFVGIGRDLMTDPDWVEKAANNQQIDLCKQCQPSCKRYDGNENCPVAIGRQRRR